MTRVHPNAAVVTGLVAAAPSPASIPCKEEEEVLTVWRKSLLLNCNGFTVFDCKGNLVFRVDNYVSGSRDEIVLMGASGNPLLTLRRKRLSFSDNWQVFDGESAANPLFTVRKQHSGLRNTKCLAQITCPGNGTESPPSSPGSLSSRNRNVLYEVEGSYQRRCCSVYDGQRQLVAEIRRKESFGNDVFRLVVQPGMNAAVGMAIVILLDQMFGSSKWS
ncbi:hypothetical protein MLD38_038340 [Melastoma candidum]|uniref:Uncharacterized protein n=1 Tax=Melastoma candidum TaxID=119954 RepID=A0ACB9KZT0_9MYRT|nr:hypothetical protein MLD38_038340 [Melastoma candidum]